MHAVSRFWPISLQSHHKASSKTRIALFLLVLSAMTAFSRAAAATEANCPEALYPRLLDEQLLITAEAESTLLARRYHAKHCSSVAADLAQLYFWGGAQTGADLPRSWAYAKLAQRDQHWAPELRLLRPLYALGGLDRTTDPNIAGEALRRESALGGLHRDKVLAALAQLNVLQGQNAHSTTLRANLAGNYRHRLWRQAHFQVGQLLAYYRLVDGGHYDSQCTASLVGDQWLITAAHCLLAPAELGRAQLERLVYRPFDDPGSNAAPLEIVAAWWHRDFSSDARLQGDIKRYSGSDVALLRLNKPVVAGTAKLMAIEPGERHLETAGFPRDKPWGSLWGASCPGKRFADGDTRFMPVYLLGCKGAVGQSGSLLFDSDGRGYGLISANLVEDGKARATAAVFNASVLRDIDTIINGSDGAEIRLMQRLSGSVPGDVISLRQR